MFLSTNKRICRRPRRDKLITLVNLAPGGRQCGGLLPGSREAVMEWRDLDFHLHSGGKPGYYSLHHFSTLNNGDIFS